MAPARASARRPPSWISTTRSNSLRAPSTSCEAPFAPSKPRGTAAPSSEATPATPPPPSSTRKTDADRRPTAAREQRLLLEPSRQRALAAAAARREVRGEFELAELRAELRRDRASSPRALELHCLRRARRRRHGDRALGGRAHAWIPASPRRRREGCRSGPARSITNDVGTPARACPPPSPALAASVKSSGPSATICHAHLLPRRLAAQPRAPCSPRPPPRS